MRMDAQALYDELKKRILNGNLSAGDRLGEIALATQYSVSRLYVKSALQKLREERLVEHIRNRGYFVADIPDSLLEEIDDIRQALEGVIIKRVIRVGTEEDLSTLSKILDRIDVFIRNGMISDGLEEVDKFYQTMYRISQYDRVVAILQTYSGYIAAIRKRSAATQEEHLLSLESTHALFDAIAARDEKKAMYYLEERQKFLMPPV